MSTTRVTSRLVIDNNLVVNIIAGVWVQRGLGILLYKDNAHILPSTGVGLYLGYS